MAVPRIANEELIERLADVFQAYGFEGASLSRISAATGLERSSLYHRFPGGKDDMAEAVLRRISERFASNVLAPLKGSGPVRARVQETGRRLQAFYENGARACLLDTLSLRDGGEGLHQAVNTVYLFWRDAFAAVAREAGLRAPRATRRAEEAIMSIHGSLILARATGDTKPFARAVSRLPELLTEGSIDDL